MKTYEGAGIVKESAPLVEEFYLGEINLEAYYVVFPVSAMAVQPVLSHETKRARYIEAHGYHLKPPTSGERQCYVVDSFEQLDNISVAATKRGLPACVTAEEIAEVKEAYEESEMADPWWIALHSGKHVHLVIAVLEYLDSLGELPSKHL